jgi:hypothetical protein
VPPPTLPTARAPVEEADVLSIGEAELGRDHLETGGEEAFDTLCRAHRHGPFAKSVASAYIDIADLVFVFPTQADVAYTIRVHDSSYALSMSGEALDTDGAWRVAWRVVRRRRDPCAAVGLGGSACQSS